MKTIWKIIIATTAAGLVLAILGLSMGASRVLYLDRAGVHVTGGAVSQITEMDLDSFENIYVDAGFSDVEFISSDRYGIDLFGDNMEWTWSLESDSLRITHKRSARVQIMNIDFISNEQNHAKIYIPDNAPLKTVTIKTSSGDISLGSFIADKVEVENSFGNVDLSNITSGQMQIDLNSGRFTGTNINTGELVYNNRFGDGHLQSVNAESFRADSNSGSLFITDCTLGEVGITNNFGDLIATGLITAKSNIRVNSGDIKVAGEFTGETIVHADFGDIKLTTSGSRSDYSFDISVKFGGIRFDGERLTDQSSVLSGSVSENHLKITASSGDIEINFAG